MRMWTTRVLNACRRGALSSKQCESTSLLGDVEISQLMDDLSAKDYSICTSWISLAQSQRLTDDDLVFLDSYLISRSYLTGTKFTVADAAMYVTLSNMIQGDGGFSKEILWKFKMLSRWFDHIQHRCASECGLGIITFPPSQQTIIPIHLFSGLTSSVGGPIVNSSDSNMAPKADTEGKAPNSDMKKKKEMDTRKTDDKDKATTPTNPLKEEETAGRCEDPSLLDLRIGLVLKCWVHESAEKLLCEEIDLGEATGPRTIASGIRAFYKPEEVQGRKVLVVANLKERSLAGFKSQGMVMCACNADHTVVKLLDIPETANIGDRVSFDGFSSEPASASQVAKKKILETVGPNFKTDGDGICKWKDIEFKVGGQNIRGQPNSLVS